MGPAFIQAKRGCVDDHSSRLSHNVSNEYKWQSATDHTAAGWVRTTELDAAYTAWVLAFTNDLLNNVVE